jgi:hypothetical protein
VHQHDEDAGLSLYFAPRILGDVSHVTPQVHFGALLEIGLAVTEMLDAIMKLP